MHPGYQRLLGAPSRLLIGLGLAGLLGLGLWGGIAMRGAAAQVTTLQPSPHIVHIHGNVAHVFTSLGELKAHSVAVVLATVTSQSPEMAPEQAMYTLSTLHIDQVLWSNVKIGSSVIVWQVGGTTADGRTRYEMEDFPIFTSGSQYVLFLASPAPKPGEYWTTGAYMGVFSLNKAGRITSYSPASAHTGVYVQDVPVATFEQQIGAS